jgi:hypothetical protein
MWVALVKDLQDIPEVQDILEVEAIQAAQDMLAV